MAKKTTDYGRPSVFSQSTNDIGQTGDKGEMMRIYEQMTGEGLVGTEDKKKGNNNRK